MYNFKLKLEVNLNSLLKVTGGQGRSELSDVLSKKIETKFPLLRPSDPPEQLWKLNNYEVAWKYLHWIFWIPDEGRSKKLPIE